VLFAKHSFVGAILDKMLEERKIRRTYVAITDGLIAKKKGTINAAIGRDRHHPTKRRVSPTGQSAITHYKVLDTFPNKNRTLIQCQLDTGRTHQIRVHLSNSGHPITGDILYGGKPDFSRLALHAARLEFIHPFTKENIICFAPFLDRPAIFPDEALDFLN
jgi:23S rRNA pseudouridine1911/1915/1917 synthase